MTAPVLAPEGAQPAPATALLFAGPDGEAVAVSATNPFPVASTGGGGATNDRELVVTTYTVKTAFTGASVGDTITCTQVLDVTASPSTVAVVWRNQTTAADLASAPNAANLTLVGVGGATEATLQSVLAGMATATLQTAGNTAMGAQADAQATNGTGSWSLIALAKGLFTVLAAMSAKLPASLGAKTGAASLSVTPSTDGVFPISASALPLPAGAATQATLASILAGQTSGAQQSKLVDAGGVTQARVIPISGDGVALNTNGLMVGALNLVFNPATSSFFMQRGDDSGAYVANSRFWGESLSPLPANGSVGSSARSSGSVSGGSGSRFGKFNVTVFADQPGTAYVNMSIDGGSTFKVVAVVQVAANVPQIISVPALGDTFSVNYVNGATAQGSFLLSTGFTAS